MNGVDSYVLPVYRRPRLPGDTTKKPVFMIHFYFVPTNLRDKKWPKRIQPKGSGIKKWIHRRVP